MSASGSPDPDAVHDFDPELWIEVPLGFPAEEFDSAEAWARQIAESAAPADAAVRERIETGAATLASAPRGGAARRFWFFPLSGEVTAIVDCFRLPRDSRLEDSLEEILGHVDAPSTDPVVTQLDPGAAMRVVRVARIGRAETAEEGPSAVYGVIRLGRVTEREIEIFETVNDDLTTMGYMMDQLDRLVIDLPVPEYESVDDRGEARTR